MTIGKIVAIVLALAVILISLFMLMNKGKSFMKAGDCPDSACGDCSFGSKCKNPCPSDKPRLGLVSCERNDKSEGRCCLEFG